MRRFIFPWIYAIVFLSQTVGVQAGDVSDAVSEGEIKEAAARVHSAGQRLDAARTLER
jgi:hypothetical protein